MRPSLLYGEEGLNEGVAVSILTRGRTSLDAVASDRWGGIGVERKVTSNLGIGGAYGWDILNKKAEPRLYASVSF